MGESRRLLAPTVCTFALSRAHVVLELLGQAKLSQAKLWQDGKAQNPRRSPPFFSWVGGIGSDFLFLFEVSRPQLQLGVESLEITRPPPRAGGPDIAEQVGLRIEPNPAALGLSTEQRAKKENRYIYLLGCRRGTGSRDFSGTSFFFFFFLHPADIHRCVGSTYIRL